MLVFYRYICWEQRYKFSLIKALSVYYEGYRKVLLVALPTHLPIRKHQVKQWKLQS